MAIVVKLKYQRHSARKLRPSARRLVGARLEQAIAATSVSRSNSGRYFHQLLKSAKAAALSREYKPEDLIVGRVEATEGPKIKRNRPNARGRSNRYQKHLAHLVLSLDLPEGNQKVSRRKAEATESAIERKNGTES